MDVVEDLRPLDAIIDSSNGKGLIPILQESQQAYGYLPKPILRHIATRLSLPLNRVYGVATFYSQFHLEPRGRHIIQQCDGTACHVRGAKRIMDCMCQELGVDVGETTDDLQVTYEVVYCLGSCGLAPVAMVDDQVVGRLTPEKMTDLLDRLA